MMETKKEERKIKAFKKTVLKKVVKKKSASLSVSKTTKALIVKKKASRTTRTTPIKRILITLPRPESERSPYFELAKKHEVVVDFQSFVRVEGVDTKEFRQQRINLQIFTAIIFTSRNAIDHYFRIIKDLKVKVSPLTKYFCTSESVALYLQKFIVYRKRKVLFADDMSFEKFSLLIEKNAQEKFLFPYSNIEYEEILACLKRHKCFYKTTLMYNVISNDVKVLIEKGQYDVICFFTAGGIKSLFDNFPDFKQKQTLMCVYGLNALKMAMQKGLEINLKAPTPENQSVYDVLDSFLTQHNNLK